MSGNPGAHVVVRDGLRLHVRTGGMGPSVLLLHGFTGSSESWGDALLDRLGRKVRWTAVDLPGHGRSDRPADPGRYTLESVVADLVDVLDVAGIDAATWIGYSMGGRIALGAAVLVTRRVRALVVESASPGLATEAERSARRREDAAVGHRLRSGGIDRFVDEWESQDLFASQAALSEDARLAQRERRRANDPAALAACLAGLGTGSQPSFWEDLPTVRVPVLLVAGSEDVKFRAIAVRMTASLPAARLEVVSGAGHAVHLEAPEAWTRAVGDFADGLPGRDAP